MFSLAFNRFCTQKMILNQPYHERSFHLEQLISADYPNFEENTETILNILAAYRHKKKRGQVMDFDDLLENWLELLLRHGEGLPLCRQIQYILVDEYQDTNQVQANILYRLSRPHKNLMVVGDDAQSIYSWRGADFGNMLEFPERYQAVTYNMEENYRSSPEIQLEIQKIMSKTYAVLGTAERKPLILLFVGVNGVGKTTTIGKIAAQYRQQGKKVLMGAGDTFRAAAIEQLVEWSRRADCDIIQKEPGSDPSAVMYETVQKGIDEDYDVVICDTAGRLHTKKNLMEELKKMVRVIRKLIPDAPHEILLVLDATTGQNAIFQTREFMEATDLTGLIITKLDGTSKGGVVIGIVNEFDIPVRYIGVGEQVEDLRPFDAQQFTESIFA